MRRLHQRRYPLYGCATGRHGQHRSFRAAARCFYEADTRREPIARDGGSRP